MGCSSRLLTDFPLTDQLNRIYQTVSRLNRDHSANQVLLIKPYLAIISHLITSWNL